MIEAGAAGVHFEDQLSSEKKCGHMGGKVLVPTSQFIRTLVAARLAADVMRGAARCLFARTDADSAKLLTSDVDERDRAFIVPASAPPKGSIASRAGSTAPSRAVSPMRRTRTCCGAKHRRPIWRRRKQFAEAIHDEFPGKMLAYNCSPSFNWKKNLDDATIAKFQRELGAMGYKFQFVTLAGFHALNHGMFELARTYKRARHGGLLRAAGARVRRRERGLHGDAPPARSGHRLFRYRSRRSSLRGKASTTALGESTETQQFEPAAAQGKKSKRI